MKTSVLGLVFAAVLIEDREEEGSVVKGAVFDGIIEFRDLRSNEKVGWPTQACDAETGYITLEGSNFSCLTSQKSSNNFSQRSRNSQGSSPQHHLS